MLLNRLFIAMFLIGFSVAFGKLVFFQDYDILKSIVDALFDAAKSGFELSIYLTGALCLWMGFLEVGEKGGAINALSKAVSPLFSKLFPEIPKNHKSLGTMMMNFSANMLGLDNAATPIGLKAMKELQELNPEKERASNAQIMFLVLNTSGLTIIPVSILAYRSAEGSISPSSVFLPILITTFISSFIGLIFVSLKQKINLFNKTILLYIGSMVVLIASLLAYIIYHPEHTEVISKVGGNGLLILIITAFFLLALRKKVNIYEVFVQGAKGGFDVAIKIIPFLVAILAAVAVFRASGALDALLEGIRYICIGVGLIHTEFIDALPVAFMKPFSGSGARGLMIEIFQNPSFGPDSFVGNLASTFQGSTETTFYVLAVYFGSVGIKNTRYAAGAGLIADLAGIIAAIFISYLFYSI
jgi:spore maturation protein SpmA